MSVTPSGADGLANTLLASLLAGKSFTVPTIDLGDVLFEQPDLGSVEPVTKLTTADLTTGQVGGTGVFDLLMQSLKVHLQEEFQANRISGSEYTKAYIGIVAAALEVSSGFLLGKDQAYQQSLLIQEQAKLAKVELVKGRLELEASRINLAKNQYEAATAEVNYGLVKMKIATEDATFNVVTNQGAGVALDNEGKTFTNLNILPLQKNLLSEQVETTRAQTQDLRTDGAAVVGVLGKQKDLYSQQITSYKRDAETKAVKIYADAWITQKTIDEGLLAPANFQNTSFDALLTKLKTNLEMV